MKEISSDKEKSIEQKMSERQEIQKQIQNLHTNYAEKTDSEESDAEEAAMGDVVIEDDSSNIVVSSNESADAEIQAQTGKKGCLKIVHTEKSQNESLGLWLTE